MKWWGQVGNVANLSSLEQSTMVLIEIIIWDAILIWLNGGVSSNAFRIVEPRFAYFVFMTLSYHLLKAISQLQNWLYGIRILTTHDKGSSKKYFPEGILRLYYFLRLKV